MSSKMRQIPFTCTLDCGSRCELVAIVENDELRRIDAAQVEDLVERPRLVPCARGRAHRRLLSSRERLTTPLRRIGPRGSGEFEEINWDEATSIIAEKLLHYRDRHGSASILCSTGAGSLFSEGINGSYPAVRFFSYWDSVSKNIGNASTHNVSLVSTWIYGSRVGSADRSDLLNAELIVLWGMNPAENRLGPNTAYQISEARKRGTRVLLIDPRHTDSGIICDQWIPVKPGTDAALAAAIAYQLDQNGQIDHAFLERCTTGSDDYLAYVRGSSDQIPKTPRWASEITRVDEGVIVALAKEIGKANPMALLPGFGPQRAAYGEQFSRAMITLACLTGNVGIPGGDAASIATQLHGPIKLASMPLGKFEPARTFHHINWTDEIKQADPPVKMLYVVSTNLINRNPDCQGNVEAVNSMDFVVVHDQFMTPTAKHADILLPISLSLEHWGLGQSWCQSYDVFLTQPIVPPLGESKSDYGAFALLAEKLGFGEAYTKGRNEREWVEALTVESGLDLEQMKRDGVYRSPVSTEIPLADFRADPQRYPRPTHSGLIELSNHQATGFGLPATAEYVADDKDPGAFPLQLLTPHSKFRSNTCLDSNPWLKEADLHAVWLNPIDAHQRGIEDGELVEVSSCTGSIAIVAKVTGCIMPGVTCVYHGTSVKSDASGRDTGASANTLTERRVSPTGGMATHSNYVEVRCIKGKQP